MAGHSILYLGRGEFAADYLEKLKASCSCRRLNVSETLAIPWETPENIDLVLFEAGPMIAQSGLTLQTLINSLSHYPLVAVTVRRQEHRGITAMRQGAQDYICIDDISEAEQENVFEHAIQRFRLMTRLSDRDGTVLGILNSINDGVIVVDQHGHVLDINPAARSILGLAPRQRPDDKWGAHFCNIATDGKTLLDRDETPFVKALSGQKFNGQVAIYRVPDQDDAILSINGQGLYDGDQSLVGGVVTFRDVTDIMKRTVELEKRAQYDELTLLPNRRLFIRQLEKGIGRCQRTSRALAVLFIDLDKFKSVNDTLGHDVGDEVLRQVAEILVNRCRKTDVVARYGGEEFLLCFPDTNAEFAEQICGQIRLAVEKADWSAIDGEAGDGINITISFGIAEVGRDSRRTTILSDADTRLYQAKNKGRNRVVV